MVSFVKHDAKLVFISHTAKILRHFFDANHHNIIKYAKNG